LTRRPRFYHPRIDGRDEIRLEEREARHAAAVLRLGPGSPVEIFDGKGASRRGVVAAGGRGALLVRFLEKAAIDPPCAAPLAIALSPPKGDRMLFAVEKLSELGCETLVPVVFKRSLDAGVRPGSSKVLRWRRRALESAKQCGRNRVMEVADAAPLTEVLASSAVPGGKIVLDRKGSLSLARILSERGRPKEPALILVGPEGGLTPKERETIAGHGLLPAHLPGNVLRIETAAVAAAALFLALSREGSEGP